MRKISFLLVIAIFITSCKSETKENKDSEMSKEFKKEHSAKLALDFIGVYEGELPCADCEFIRIKISINEDGTYYSKFIYEGKNNEVFDEFGTYKWEENNNIIQLTSEDKSKVNKYKVGEGWILQLNQNGEEIESSLSEKYYLRKA